MQILFGLINVHVSTHKSVAVTININQSDGNQTPSTYME